MPSENLGDLYDDLKLMGEWYPPQIAATEAYAYINAGIVAFQIRMTEIDEQRVATTDDSTVAPSAGDATSALPAGCEKLLTVAVADSASPVGWTQLDRINRSEFYDLVGPISANKRQVKYMLEGSNIRWWPEASGDAIRVVYIGTITELTDPAHTYDPGISGWKQWVLSHAAQTCAAKLDEDTRSWARIHEQADARLAWQARYDHARPRRLSGAPPVQPQRMRFRY